MELYRASPMGSDLYVGHLSCNLTSSDIENTFSQDGTVKDAVFVLYHDFDLNLISDRDCGTAAHLGPVDATGVDPAQSTGARPGSEEKVQMLAARYAAGLALWNVGDRRDFEFNERDLIEAMRDPRLARVGLAADRGHPSSDSTRRPD